MSTHNQEELSPDAQKRLLLDYACANDFVVNEHHIYMEQGVSGRKAVKRPKFQEMIAMAKSKGHPFDAILIWKFSRFARNQEESIVYKSLLHKNQVEVISISEPLADGPFGSLIERIIEWMDEYYSIRLSSEVMRGMTENALRGNFQAAAPYGYQIPYKGACPCVVPKEAEVVQMIFQMYVNEQMSPFAIARYLNQMGLHSKRGNAFESRTIQYILENPIYIGYARWNKRSQSSGSQVIKPPDEWIHVKGNFEPILSVDIYEKAQVLLSQNQKCFAKKPNACKKHWLSGMVKCSACQRSLALSRTLNKKTNKVYLNFQCYGYLKGICTCSHQISEKRLVPPILDALNKVTALRHTSYQLIHKTTEPVHTNQDILTSQLDKLESKLNRARMAYVNGIDTLDEYQMLKHKLLSEKEELVLKLKTIADSEMDTCTCPLGNCPLNENGGSAAMPSILKPNDFLSQLLVIDQTSLEQKQTAFRSVVKEIVFYKKENLLTITFSLNGKYIR